MKRILSAILAAALTLGAVCGITAGASAAAIYGDTDGNGEVEIVDVTLIQRHLANMITLDENAQKRGAVTDGRELSITDATLIQRYLANQITSFPAEEKPSDEPTKVKDDITIHFTDSKNWGSVYAYLYNDATGDASAEWPGEEMNATNETGENGKPILTLTVDVSKYDRVIFSNGGSKVSYISAVTKASSGFTIITKFNGGYVPGVYPYDQKGTGSLDIFTLDYPEGYKKTIYVWLPEGYDPEDTDKKYSVLYMCDGHNLFDKIYSYAGAEWQCDESVISLMQNGGDGVILVGIDNSGPERVTELTPDIGEINPDMLTSITDEVPAFHGDIYADFVVDDLIPYIESRYNTNSIRGVAGSSCGGQEAFYIGMEHPDKFRYIGAFSSAFTYFTDEAWDDYLSEKDFSGDMPRLYLYTGHNDKDNTEFWIYISACKMGGWLKEHGYPADKLVDTVNEGGLHNEKTWALFFPDMLCWGLEL